LLVELKALLSILTVEIGVGEKEEGGVGEGLADLLIKGKLFFKLILPVTTAKKTITTTKPKIKESTRFKLSI